MILRQKALISLTLHSSLNAFNIQIPVGIEKAAREGVEGDGLNSDGTLTDEALEKLESGHA